MRGAPRGQMAAWGPLERSARRSGVRVLTLEARGLATTDGLVEDHLADADDLGRDLDAFVVTGELEALLEGQHARGVIDSNVSELAARMLVSFFSLVMFTSMSSAREFSPMTMPS